MRPPRPADWKFMTRAQWKTWKKQGGKHRDRPGPCNLGGALLPPSLGTVAKIVTAHGMAEATEVGAAAVARYWSLMGYLSGRSAGAALDTHARTSGG